MKRITMNLMSLLPLIVFVIICYTTTDVESKPITLLTGTPFLFNTYDSKVDPNEASNLSPAFQAANGQFGANLVAYFGTGNLN